MTRVPLGWRPFRFSEPPYTETEMLSFWWNFHHWLHWKLSKRQLPMQSVMKISSRWRHFRFSVDNSDNGAMCAVEDHDFSLCVVPFSLLSFCMLLLFYVTFVYFRLSMSDNSPCGYCYLLTVPDVKWILSFLSFPFFSFLLFIMKRIKSYIRNTFEIVSVGPLYKRHRILLSQDFTQSNI